MQMKVHRIDNVIDKKDKPSLSMSIRASKMSTFSELCQINFYGQSGFVCSIGIINTRNGQLCILFVATHPCNRG